MQQDANDLLQALYEEYRGTLRVVALKSGIPFDEIDDIIQDTFCAYIRVYRDKLPKWNEAQRIGMLMKILKNRCSDYFRDKKRRLNVSLDSGNFGEELQLLDKYVMKDVLDCVTDQEEIRILQEYIKEMKPDWQEVAILHFVQEKTIPEVSKILNISNAACAMRISRIRKYLREQADKK